MAPSSKENHGLGVLISVPTPFPDRSRYSLSPFDPPLFGITISVTTNFAVGVLFLNLQRAGFCLPFKYSISIAPQYGIGISIGDVEV